MKTVVLLYNTSCIYEIVILNYFLKFTNKNVEFVSVDGKGITSMEGYSINVTGKLSEMDAGNVELMVVPGGNIKEIESTHSTDLDIAVTDKVITSRANGYVDFAIEVAKKMNLFADEKDLQETIAFWRDYQRMQ